MNENTLNAQAKKPRVSLLAHIRGIDTSTFTGFFPKMEPGKNDVVLDVMSPDLQQVHVACRGISKEVDAAFAACELATQDYKVFQLKNGFNVECAEAQKVRDANAAYDAALGRFKMIIQIHRICLIDEFPELAAAPNTLVFSGFRVGYTPLVNDEFEEETDEAGVVGLVT